MCKIWLTPSLTDCIESAENIYQLNNIPVNSDHAPSQLHVHDHESLHNIMGSISWCATQLQKPQKSDPSSISANNIHEYHRLRLITTNMTYMYIRYEALMAPKFC